MAETLEKQVSALEQIYMKYFSNLDKIDAVYHRTSGNYNSTSFTRVVSRAEANLQDEVERMIRKALFLTEDGYKNNKGQDLQDEQLLFIRSLLANLPKLQNVQLKKAVLFSLRRYSHNVGDTTREIEGLERKADKVRLMVARAAIANKLGTTDDFYVMGTNYVFTKELLNDLIAQAKEDIKAEMATNVPSFMEIKHICACVYNAAQDSKVPEKTLNILSQEFNEDKIIAGGDHIAKFETTIEVDHAQAEKDKIKAAWYDKMKEEAESAKKEAEYWRKQMEIVSASAENMRASVFSIGVNRHKMLVAAIGQSEHTK